MTWWLAPGKKLQNIGLDPEFTVRGSKKVTNLGFALKSHVQNRDETQRDQGLQERLPLSAKEDHQLVRIDTMASSNCEEAMALIVTSWWQSAMSTMVDAH